MHRTCATLIIAIGAFLGLSVATLAAPKPPMPSLPTAWTWTGVYVGGNLGYSWGNSNTTMTFSDPTGLLLSQQSNFSMPGFVGGGQAGYNWQVTNWVLGLEADIEGTGQGGYGTFVCVTTVCGFGPITDTLNQRLRWFDTARGRVGVLATPEILLYVTGGLAYGDIRSTEAIVAPFQGAALAFDTIKTGWTIGTGVEGHIAGNWTWRLQYLHLDFGNVSGSGTTSVITSGFGFCDGHPCPLTPAFASHITDNVVTAGINFKWP
jgi:outer membrane immunogenic protein